MRCSANQLDQVVVGSTDDVPETFDLRGMRFDWRNGIPSVSSPHGKGEESNEGKYAKAQDGEQHHI
jgi:hypothetical protein